MKRGHRGLEASMEFEVDGHRALLFLLLSRALKIVVFFRRQWQHSKYESHVSHELLVVDPQHPEFTRMNLNASPYLVRLYRCRVIRYLE
jgi:hypothetical protein